MHFKDSQNRYLWGFTLMAKFKIAEFYTLSIDERDLWVDKMKSFVVMLDIKDEYSIAQLIGNGNFAKVHACNHKKDLYNKCALKTVSKTTIQASERNIVRAILYLLHCLHKIIW